MTNRLDREVDVERGPAKVIGRNALHEGDLIGRGATESWKFGKWKEQLLAIEQQP